MADDSPTRFRDYRGTKGQIDDAEASGPATPPKAEAPKSKGVTADQAKRTERTEDGVKTYGPPMDTGASDTARMRANQSTDSAN